MDWGRYVVFDPGVSRPLGEVTRTEACAALELLMKSNPVRVQELRVLADRNGVDISDLNALNDWFAHSVVGSDSTEGRLANTWYSVVNNIGLYLGEQIIAQTDSKIRWEMVKHRKNDVSYQRHVLRGFDVPNPTTRSTPIS